MAEGISEAQMQIVRNVFNCYRCSMSFDEIIGLLRKLDIPIDIDTKALCQYTE